MNREVHVCKTSPVFVHYFKKKVNKKYADNNKIKFNLKAILEDFYSSRIPLDFVLNMNFEIVNIEKISCLF